MNTPISGQLSRLRTSEKIQLVEDLWDDIALYPESLPVSNWQKTELDRRKAAYKKKPPFRLYLGGCEEKRPGLE